VGTSLLALHLPDGKALWRYEGQGASLQPPHVAGDLIVWFNQRASAADGAPAVGVLQAIDSKTGVLKWQRELKDFGGPGGAIPSADGRLVFNSTPPVGLDAATGEVKWEAKVAGLAMGGPALSEDGRRLYVAAADPKAKGGTLAALDSANGQVAWQVSLGESTLNPMERAWPLGDLVITPLWSGEIVALSADDGHERWRYHPRKPRMGGITVADGRAWLMQQNLEVVQLDAASGEAKARFALDIDLSSMRSFAPRPVVVGKRVLAPLTVLLGVFDAP
jgi:outer membrane protein assembly factor BamB